MCNYRFEEKGNFCSNMNFATAVKQIWSKGRQMAPTLRATISKFNINMIMVKKSERLIYDEQVIFLYSK